MSEGSWPPRDGLDEQHEERLRRLERRQEEATRWLRTLREHVRLLRERAGLPRDLERA